MGEMADHYAEQNMNDIIDGEERYLDSLELKPTWRNQHGATLVIKKMDTDHIANTILYLDRKGRFAPPALAVELAKRYKLYKEQT